MNLTEAKKYSDKEIIDLILNKGNKHLFELLYDRYSEKVFHKCILITKDREISKDLTHDIFIKIFLNLSKYKGTSSFSLWIHSISYNHCIDFLKKKKRLQLEQYDDFKHDEINEALDENQEQLLKEMQLVELEKAFEQLKQEDKIILLMRYKDNIPVKDIAESLQLGLSALKMRLKRARARLADKVSSIKELN